MRLTDAELDELEQAAREATPGERRHVRNIHDLGRCWYIGDFGSPMNGDECALVETGGGQKCDELAPAEAEAAFCAACTRERILGLVAEVREARALVRDLVAQACSTNKGTLDSCAISDYAEALRYLAGLGEVEIEVDVRRRVVGRWRR